MLGFGYQEHPATWAASGADVRIVDRREALLDADVAVVVNPNNPDGRTVARVDLLRVAKDLAMRGGMLIVDEAFADVADPGLSLVPVLPPNAVVLRSFGKMYGLAGLRLGFAVTAPRPAAALRDALGPWPVSGPALAIATRALADADWQVAALARLRADARRLDTLLDGAGLPVRGGTPLFRLVETPRAKTLFETLGRAGILVRAFAERPDWLRFGLPGEAPAWDRLAEALTR